MPKRLIAKKNKAKKPLEGVAKQRKQKSSKSNASTNPDRVLKKG